LFETGALSPDVTSGRVESDRIPRAFFWRRTRGGGNDEDVASASRRTGLFETGLYQTEPFAVTITCSDPNAAIYYTTNGEEPTTARSL
jgi:hypothetical protein